MHVLHRITVLICRVATVFATLAFSAVVIAFAYGVFARYVLNNPSDVAGELSIVFYLWAVMIGGSLAVSLHSHISFELLVDRLPARAGRAVEGIGAAIAGAVLLYALPTTLEYVQFLWREKTPSLELPLSQVYACFVIFQAAMAVTLIARAATLAFGRGFPEHPDDVRQGVS
jgi:TRAP-type C4-dicarboxylate transport system permease small subunit